MWKSITAWGGIAALSLMRISSVSSSVPPKCTMSCVTGFIVTSITSIFVGPFICATIWKAVSGETGMTACRLSLYWAILNGRRKDNLLPFSCSSLILQFLFFSTLLLSLLFKFILFNIIQTIRVITKNHS